jgi:hypothetical protein
MKETMKATFETKQTDGKVRQNRKEDHFCHQYSGLVPSDGKNKYSPLAVEVVTLRLYCTAQRSYACIWAHGPDGISLSGGGYAGGYGYHRPSAAAGNAIREAGIVLDEDINGRGDSAIREAVEAIARAVSGQNVVQVMEAYA